MTVIANEPLYEIHQGDCKRVLKRLKDSSVAAVVTSPPYWGLRTYGGIGEIGAEAKLDTYVNALVKVFNEVHRVLKDDGTIWIVIGDSYTSGNRGYRHADKRHAVRAMPTRPTTPTGLKEKDLIGVPWRVALALQAHGWYFRTEVIWHKPNPIPESVRDRPHRSHEYVLLFSKSKKYSFDMGGFDLASAQNGGRFDRTVWTIPVGQERTGHSAVFPRALVRPCVYASTKKDDLVLDPFAGIGSVGVVCMESERRFVGIDLNADFCQKAKIRIAEAYSESHSRLSALAM